MSYFKQGFDAGDQGDFGKTTDGYSITTRPLHTINPPALAHALPERRTWQSMARHWPTVRWSSWPGALTPKVTSASPGSHSWEVDLNKALLENKLVLFMEGSVDAQSLD